MDKAYWENYYKKHGRPAAPSLFAEYVLDSHVKERDHLLELGCGNGRDSVFFAQNGVVVRAVDQVESEIQFLTESYAHDGLTFATGDFTNLGSSAVMDCIYSRFTLHSIAEREELGVLDWVVNHLRVGGVFCVEARSVNDPKLQDGERVSENENIVDGHYRRYFDLDKFKDRLAARGLKIIFAEERTGFAPYGDEDPPVVRVVAQK